MVLIAYMALRDNAITIAYSGSGFFVIGRRRRRRDGGVLLLAAVRRARRLRGRLDRDGERAGMAAMTTLLTILFTTKINL